MATEIINLESAIVKTVSLNSGISIDVINLSSEISIQVDRESKIKTQIDLVSEVLE